MHAGSQPNTPQLMQMYQNNLNSESTTAPPSTGSEPPAGSMSKELSPQQAREAFEQDPVGFVTRIVDQLATLHLQNLKEQVELQAALQALRQSQPEFRQFEPFILQELAHLIQSDEDGILDPWPQLLNRATTRFRERFQQLAKQQPELIKPLLNAAAATQDTPPSAVYPYLEQPGNRQPLPADPSFSRQQIKRMSLDEFLAQEDAINQAMRQNRIK